MDTQNLDIYGSAPLAWTRVLGQLEASDSKGSYWLATTRPDGRPHVAGVGAVWVDGKFYFVSGAATRKSRNLAQNPNCVLSVSLPDLDLVVEGTAAPWDLYEVTAVTAIGVATAEPHGATRWRFA